MKRMKHIEKYLYSGMLLLCTGLMVQQADAQKYQWVKGSNATVANFATRKSAIDKSGNSIITGQYKGKTDFNFSDAPADTAYLGSTPSGSGFSVFFAKYDAAGNYVWAKRIYNGRANQSIDIADVETDDSSNVYIAGNVTGFVDLDPSDIAADTTVRYSTLNGTTYSASIYVAKYDKNGALKWAMSLRGSSSNLTDIAIRKGRLYMTGDIRTSPSFTQKNVDFNPSPLPADTFYLPGSGDNNAFMAAYDLDGNFKMAQRIYNATSFTSFSIDADSNRNMYITGGIWDLLDMNPASGAADTFFLTTELTTGVYLAKYDSTGAFKWARAVVPEDYMQATDQIVKLKNNNELYLTGSFLEKVDFNPGTGIADTFFMTPSPGAGPVAGNSSYILHYDASGNFKNAFTLGSATGISDKIVAIDFDDSANLYLAGNFIGTADFNLQTGLADTFKLKGVGASKEDVFFAKYKNDTLVWARKVGNSDAQVITSMNVRNITARTSTLRIYGRFLGDVIFSPDLPVDMSSQLVGGGSFLSSYSTFPLSSAKDLLTYAFTTPPAAGTISHDSVFVTVPAGTATGGLVATFTVSPYAHAVIGATPQVSGTTPNNFASMVTYTIVAEDLSTKDYKVFVKVEPVSVRETAGAEALRVWPNPAHETLYFSAPADVQLYDLRGVRVKAATQAKELSLDGLVPGIYILEHNLGGKQSISVK
jgi:hypothetical protein